jgi:hypothetical protein
VAAGADEHRYCVEILLPLVGDDGGPRPRAPFDALKARLVDRFGGLTAFTRAPAEGLWDGPGDGVERDRIVIFEVMAAELDEPWWAGLREALERDFRQQEVVIRAHEIRRL